MALIGQDTFAGRIVTNGWGTASDGEVWNGTTGIAAFSVSDNEGQVTGATTRTSYYPRLSNKAADVDQIIRFTPASSMDYFGLLSRFVDGNNLYQFQIGNGTFLIKKYVAGVPTILASISYTLTPGQAYWLRAVTFGTALQAKVWADGSAEPAIWTLQTTDGSINSAAVFGIFVNVAVNGSKLTVDSYTIQSNTALAAGTARAMAYSALTFLSPYVLNGALLDSDTFANRTVTSGWGTASGGSLWSGTGTSDFSVSGGEGRVTYNNNASYFCKLGVRTAADQEQLVRWTPAGSQDYFGLLLRYVNGNNLYLFRNLGGTLHLSKYVNGIFTDLASVPFPLVAGQAYWLRGRSQGDVLSGKLWADDTPEPQLWTLATTDKDVSSPGNWGLYVSNRTSGQTLLVDSYSIVPGYLSATPALAQAAAPAAILGGALPLLAAPAAAQAAGQISTPAIAIVQQATNAADSVSSLAVTLSSVPLATSVLVATLALDSPTVTVMGIMQSGVTWTPWFGVPGSATTAAAWYGVVNGAADTGITITLSNTTSIAANVSEWAGLDQNAPNAAIAPGSFGTENWADTGLLVPSVGQRLILSLAAWQGSATASAPGDRQARLIGAATPSIGLEAAYFNQNPPAPSYEYWVSTVGNDNNPGTQSQPWATFGHALSQSFLPGTTVHFAAGTYTEPPVVSNSSGTADQRITYVSDVPWGAKLVSTATGLASAWTNNGNYVVIQGFDITNPDGSIGLQNEGSYCRYIGNRVHDTCLTQCSSYGGAGIDHAHIAAEGNETIGNVVTNIGPGVNANCGLVQGIYQSNPGGYIANNVINEIASWAIHLWHNPTATHVTNNWIANAGSGGIVVGADDLYTADNCYIANNEVRDTPEGIHETGNTGPGNRYVNNNVYNCTTSVLLQTGQAFGTTFLDPQVVNYQPDGSGDYHLTAGSPMIDTGIATGAPNTDNDGNIRPAGLGYDRGPYEYGSVSPAIASPFSRTFWTLTAVSPFAAGTGALANNTIAALAVLTVTNGS